MPGETFRALSMLIYRLPCFDYPSAKDHLHLGWAEESKGCGVNLWKLRWPGGAVALGVPTCCRETAACLFAACAGAVPDLSRRSWVGEVGNGASTPRSSVRAGRRQAPGEPPAHSAGTARPAAV